jgi:hypothetical protein
MSYAEATRILICAIAEDDGTFTLLRMGQDPGPNRIAELRQSLRLLARELADANEFPRDIAYACGVILHFEDEGISNLRHFHGDESAKETVLNHLRNLSQDAFNVLAGEIV